MERARSIDLKKNTNQQDSAYKTMFKIQITCINKKLTQFKEDFVAVPINQDSR